MKHREAYEKALKDGLCLKLKYLKFLFFGPPRSGKTSTRRRLVREIVNLSELGTPSISTGVAESHDVIIKKLCVESAVVSGSQWLSMKRSESIGKSSHCEGDVRYLVQLYFQLISKNNASATNNKAIMDQSSKLNNISGTAVTGELASAQINGAELNPSESIILAQADRSTLPSATESGVSQKAELDDKAEDETLSGVLTDSEVIEIEDAFKKLEIILQSDSPEDLKQLLEDLIMINMMDVGGQPAFLEMLPALTISPALYFLFFRLDQQLKKYYPVRFQSAESKGEITLETSYCIEDVLYQCLASIYCFSCHLAQPESTSRPQASSSAFLFGTYKDKVSDDQISQVEHTLQEKLIATQLYQEGILLKSSKGKMFISVDNMHGTENSEMSDIRKEIESTIKMHFPTIPIPISWLMFKIVLQLLNKPVVSLSQCKEIAEQLKMSSPVQDALWFFHHDVGSLLHYTNISSMKDTVICNPQVIFDCISTLIIDKFQYGNRALKPSEVDDFLQKGIFSLSRIKEMTENQQFEGSYLTLNQLVDLLQYLNVLAEIKDECLSQPEQKFIMPAVLKYASDEELKQVEPSPTDSQQQAPALVIHFEGGFVPFGVFCAIVAHLIAHQDSFTPKWQLCNDQVRRNKVTFCVDGALYTTFISQPQFIKIFAVRHQGARKRKRLPYLCSSVRRIVVKALETILSKMKYKPFGLTVAPSKRPFDLAFTCCLDDTHCDHMMTVFKADEGEWCAKCLKGGIELDLDDKQLIWFEVRQACHRATTSWYGWSKVYS